MSGFNMSEWIARSPKEVFDFITASENGPKVAPNIKSMVKLTEGMVGVGTRYRETRLMNGKEAQAELEQARSEFKSKLEQSTSEQEQQLEQARKELT